MKEFIQAMPLESFQAVSESQDKSSTESRMSTLERSLKISKLSFHQKDMNKLSGPAKLSEKILFKNSLGLMINNYPPTKTSLTLL